MNLTSFSHSAPRGQTNLHVIAERKNLNVNSLEEYNLTFERDTSAKNTIPAFAKITRDSGIISSVKCSLFLNGEKIKDVSRFVMALGSTAKQAVINFDEELAYSTDGQYSLKIEEVNGCSASINVEIYGFKSVI